VGSQKALGHPLPEAREEQRFLPVHRQRRGLKGNLAVWIAPTQLQNSPMFEQALEVCELMRNIEELKVSSVKLN